MLVLIESIPVKKKQEKYKHKPDRKVGYLKMIVMQDLKSKSINKMIKKSVDKETIVLSDAYKGYNQLEGIIK